MKSCSKCGFPMRDEDIFCSKCGNKFEKRNTTNMVAQYNSQPNVVAAQPQSYAPNPPQYVPQPINSQQQTSYNQLKSDNPVPVDNHIASASIFWGVAALFCFIIMACFKFKYNEFVISYGTDDMKRDLTFLKVWFILMGGGSLSLLIGWLCAFDCLTKKNRSTQVGIGIAVCALALLCFLLNVIKLTDRIEEYKEVNEDYQYRVEQQEELERRVKWREEERKYEEKWGY